MNNTSGVGGVASLGSELFVVRQGMSGVDVYSTTDFTRKREIAVPGLKNPRGLAACAVNNCLYISDWICNRIHRADLSNSLVTIWPVDGNPFGLSVMKNHHLLVALSACKTIREYTTQGTVTKKNQNLIAAWIVHIMLSNCPAVSL